MPPPPKPIPPFVPDQPAFTDRAFRQQALLDITMAYVQHHGRFPTQDTMVAAVRRMAAAERSLNAHP